MRIVLVNWAKIEDGASHGGGVNGYCLAIGRELARRGHRVTSISSGVRYVPPPPNGPACWIERRGEHEGIDCFEVVNSPVLAPSMAQFRDPGREASAPDLEQCLRDFFRQHQPDIVHVHNVEGYSAGCVHTAAAQGARVIYSLHNYHTLCPQVYLMQGHRRPCHSFDNGHACTGCIVSVDPADERKHRILSSASAPSTAPLSVPPSQLPPPPPPPWETIERPAWRPLLNVITPEPASTKPPNDYALRRAAMVSMLNSCSRVLAVSDFVRQKFESMGVQPARMRTLHIGTGMVDLARRSPNPYSRAAGGPIRLAFVGYHNWFKGLPMLLDSLELLTPEYLARIHLTVLAINLPMVELHLRRLEPRLAGLRTSPGYSPPDLPRELAQIDLGVVPSVWWDNAPQTVMEFHACGIPILAAELGGIPEFIRNGIDGLLFRGNDRWDLARHLAALVRNPRVLDTLRSGVRPPKAIAEHVTELEQEYMDRVS